MNSVDDYVTAPMYGYKDRHEYRAAARASHKMHLIKVACLYLHSWDDFVLGPKCVPQDIFTKLDNIILATTKVGGHICHFETGRFGIFPSMWF